MVLKLKAHITSYRYNGPHRHRRPDTKTFDRNYAHYDWKYKITYNGLTVYYRQGFCTHAAAINSLRKNWFRIASTFQQ